MPKWRVRSAVLSALAIAALGVCPPAWFAAFGSAAPATQACPVSARTQGGCGGCPESPNRPSEPASPCDSCRRCDSLLPGAKAELAVGPELRVAVRTAVHVLARVPARRAVAMAHRLAVDGASPPRHLLLATLRN